ncbi:HEPN domain-containing protein [Paractinoplanes atraurantiacus]|uniref:RiboL-PSP-HEPN domain-containing protein n=1 Tax=Paractinoplanes atraurantiacus TaxID=1036182 RepID=A0A285J0B0_9ACTN|nr:HEPN domain-containing protein [Actinoplanes atraurantiacus]SNY53672.1 hypothetical protein SAMN05421748_114129 [Actinoplanes atraurantiacus]
MPTSKDKARVAVLRIKSELDAAYLRYRQALVDLDFSLQEDLHKYMCIRLSGYLEQLLFEAVSGFLADSHNEAVRNFGISFFKKAPNLSPGALETLISRFGETWSQELAEFLNAHERRNSLGALVEIRNKTAHGQSYRGGQLSVSTYKAVVDDIHAWVLERMLT